MKQTKGFTLVELLVVVAILALLISILMPTLQKAREQARKAVCVSNLKHIHLGCMLYATEWNDYMITNLNGREVSTPLKSHPHYLWWPETLHLYGGLPLQSLAQDTSGIYWCPSATKAIREAEGVPYPNFGLYAISAYAINRRLLNHEIHVQYSDIDRPAERFCFVDCNISWVDQGGYNIPGPGGWPWMPHLRHRGKVNMVFGDGHVERDHELPLPMTWPPPPPYPW